MARTSDFDKFLAEVTETIPEGRREAFKEMMNDEGVAKAVKERVMARSDYSRSKDDLDSKTKEFQDYVAGETKKIEQWYDWYGTATKEVAALKTQNEAYKSTFGELDGTNSNKPKYMTREDYEKSFVADMRERDAAAIKFADVLTDLKLDYHQEFGKRLNTDAVLKLAQEKGLPMQAAFNEYVAKDREDKRNADFETKLAAAKAEGRKEALSEHKLPMQSGSPQPHVLDLQKDVARTSPDRVAAAVADWMGTEHNSGSY